MHLLPAKDSGNNLALAVSGGPDSMAMLHMIYELGLAFTAITVNHNLRPEASQEADLVALECLKLKIPHVTLKWQHKGIKSNIHDRAREARYGLMTDWCRANGISFLATAHHMDDRIEHFFIRISRGAGLLGLLDHEKMLYNNINIIRPMFDFSKTELLEYLRDRNINYAEDQSNSDTKYLRTNIRQWLEKMPKELKSELFKKRLLSVKENLARASMVVTRIFEEEASKVKYEEGKAIIEKLPIDEEIAIMLVSHILPKIGEQKDPPRMESMKKLYTKLERSSASKTTLCGCIIERKKNGIFISKENRQK